MNFQEELKKRILILDGGMGTCIQSYGLQYDGNNDMLPVTHPEIIEAIHKAYVDAGADIIETCSFSANAISQAGYNAQDKIKEMCTAAAKCARKAADSTDRKVWVAGSMGPTDKSLTIIEMMMDPEETVTRESMEQAYKEQALALIEGGVDLLLVETITDAANAQAALEGIKCAFAECGKELPVMVSASIMAGSTCLMTGTPVSELFSMASQYGIVSAGINCSFGATELYEPIKEVAGYVKCAVSVYPNAGLPTANGYDEKPADTAAAILRMAQDGLVNIAGGCCGTTPAHIKAIAESLKGISARKLLIES